ncbi:MAG: hypothetical protein HC915_01275 [Anaerolineae bacterium]|nr:hypothetical protein [Anaerolineae bacterium]
MKAYTHHLIFCEGGDCEGKELAKEAKKLLGKASVTIKRSQVGCLGACKIGPILIVYPDGVWYRCPNKKALAQIIEEHVLGGVPVKKYMVHQMRAATEPATR